MNASATENITGAYRGGIPLNVTLHSWPIPKLDTILKQMNETNYTIDKNSESAKNFTNSLHNLNATGYVAIEDDLTDTGLTDVQTFILAGIATVIPLLIIVVTILGIRFLWRRYRAKKEDGYEGVLQKEESSEPLGKQSFSLTIKPRGNEPEMTMTETEEITSTHSTQLPTPKSNGNVITMTLRNNHLIVETEESTDPNEEIKVDSKGSITKFFTSKTPDCIFENHSEGVCKKSSVPFLMDHSANSYKIPLSSDHGAIVHCAAEETDDELEKGNSNTGLSQSDLSVSSSESQNPSYRYGNQMGYDSGGYGYPEYSGYSTISKENTTQTGPKSHKIYIRGYSITEQADSYILESQGGGQKLLKDILMSDIQAREKREYDIQCEEQHVFQNSSEAVKNTTEVLPHENLSFTESTIIPENKDSQVTHTKIENFQINKNEHLTNNGMTKEENNKS